MAVDGGLSKWLSSQASDSKALAHSQAGAAQAINAAGRTR